MAFNWSFSRYSTILPATEINYSKVISSSAGINNFASLERKISAHTSALNRSFSSVRQTNGEVWTRCMCMRAFQGSTSLSHNDSFEGKFHDIIRWEMGKEKSVQKSLKKMRTIKHNETRATTLFSANTFIRLDVVGIRQEEKREKKSSKRKVHAGSFGRMSTTSRPASIVNKGWWKLLKELVIRCRGTSIYNHSICTLSKFDIEQGEWDPRRKKPGN